MAIKNKDGSVYKLRGPNPIMKDQAEWDKSKIKLINCNEWNLQIIEDKRNPIKEMKSQTIDIGEELELEENPPVENIATKTIPANQFINEIKVKETKLKKEPQKVNLEVEVVKQSSPVVLNVDSKTAKILQERGTQFYCAPVVGTKTHTDDLYGETYKTLVYGEQYIFDAVIIDQSDLQLQFWCIKSIAKGSIIHKKSLEKEGGERWWRVEELEPKSEGFLVVASISDTNPDFS